MTLELFKKLVVKISIATTLAISAIIILAMANGIVSVLFMLIAIVLVVEAIYDFVRDSGDYDA